MGAVDAIGEIPGGFGHTDRRFLHRIRLSDFTSMSTLTNYSDMLFTVLASTNVALSFSQWSNLGTTVGKLHQKD